LYLGSYPAGPVVSGVAQGVRTYGSLSTTFRKKVGWIDNPPVKEPPPQSVAQLGSPARAEAAAEVSTSLPGDPKVHTGAATLPATKAGAGNFFALDSQRSPNRHLRRLATEPGEKPGLIAKVWLEDPSLCRSCGKPMPIVAAITSPGRDDVIEKILRHLQIWDPPWQRERAPRARAPPPPSEFDDAPPPSEPELIDPPFDDELSSCT